MCNKKHAIKLLFLKRKFSARLCRSKKMILSIVKRKFAKIMIRMNNSMLGFVQYRDMLPIGLYTCLFS